MTKSSSTIEKCRFDFIGWYHVTLLTMGLVIILINASVFMFIKTSRILKRNAGNFILMGLSLVDLLTGFHAVYHVIPTYYFMTVDTCDNNLFDAYNNAGFLLGKICLLGSIGHLLLLAGERMIGLFRPIRSKIIVTKNSVVFLTVLVWLVSICMPLIELTYRGSSNRDFYNRIHVMITIIGFWMFPAFLLFIQYVAMLLLIYKFQQGRREAGIQMKGVVLKYKAFFIYLAMFVSFLVSCSPHFAVRIIIAFTDQFSRLSKDLLGVIVIFRYIPSLVNPILYAFFKRDFQETLSKTMTRKRNNLKEPRYSPSWLKRSSLDSRLSKNSKNTEQCELIDVNL